ncbi:MAG: 1-phosphofructokinase [Clostridia bacterium]|nr:1-phosphofructokinase [Clostridia bacterium]
MIYTLTFNPSVDYVVRLETFREGITNRTKGEEYYFGGKGINVSMVLAELGIESTALGFIAGFTGDAIEKGLKESGICTDFIRLHTGISRINIKIRSETESEINAQGPGIDESSLDFLMQKIDTISDGDTLVLAGSIPNTVPDNIYEIILQRLSRKNVITVVDASKELLLNTLKYHPFLIKPNRQELEEIFHAEIESSADIEKYAAELKNRGAVNVLVSLGGEGAFLLDEFGRTHRTGVLKGEVQSTVGSGDSMVAGFIAGYQSRKDYDYALRLGTACGNATAFSNGLAKKEKILSVLQSFLTLHS